MILSVFYQSRVSINDEIITKQVFQVSFANDIFINCVPLLFKDY